MLWSLFAIAAMAAAAWVIISRRAPEPPLVPLASLDPQLATLLQTSRAAVVAAPKSAAAWGRLGQALHASEFAAEARLCYSNAAARDATDFRWPYLLGLLEMKDRPELSVAHLQRATELAATAADVPRFQLARALIETGRAEEAAPHLQTLLAANPEHAAARVELARVYLARGTLKEATLELGPAMTNTLTTRPALLIAAQIAQRNGQAADAAQLSRRAATLPRPPDWPDPVLRAVKSLRVDRAHLADQANAFLQQQRTLEAEAALTRLLESFPNDAEGLLLFGRLRYLQQRCPEAEMALRKHLAVQTNSLNGLVQLGLALLCERQWTNAAAVFEQALALKPDFAQAYSNLGLARSRAGDGAGALRAYRDALRCNPGDVSAHILLAEELANAGELAEAKEHIARATALNPNDPRLRAAREQLGLPPP